MSDNDADENPEMPALHFIPDQIVAAGSNVEILFSKFTAVSNTSDMEYSISGFPDNFTIDPKTGVLTGVAPTTELNQIFVVTMTLTHVKTKQFANAIFKLEVIGTLLLETPESRAFFARENTNFWDSIKTWELQVFIQQLIVEHFAWVLMYDSKEYLGTLGKFENRRIARTGWNVVVFENGVMITPGDKAFEQYGNRRRLLETLREAYRIDIAPKKWDQVLLQGSDLESIGKAWVIGKELEMPMTEVAPTDAAEINFYNLNRIYAGQTPSKKPQLGGS